MLKFKNFLIILGIIVVGLENSYYVKSEFYSSVQKMTDLVNLEGKFLKNLDKFIDKNENKIDYLRARLNEMEKEYEETISEGEDNLENPVNRYLLTKRLSVDWDRIENLMEHNTGKKNLQNIKKWSESLFPDDGEFKGAAEGLLRLQEFYRLKSADIAAGILREKSYGTSLNAETCYDIGSYATSVDLPRLGYFWLTEALNRFQNQPKTFGKPFLKADILFELAKTKSLLGDYKGANETMEFLLKAQPDNEAFVKFYSEFMKDTENKSSLEVDYSEEHELLPADLLSVEHGLRSKLTCNGLIHKTPAEEKYLRCGYLSETHPFLILAPIKVEEVNHDPLLVVYYDVLSDGEIDIVKNMAMNRFQRATVIGLNASRVTNQRTSQFCFIPKTEHKVLQTIDRRVEDMTGLNMDYVEQHQISNYGIGGHYTFHHDYFEQLAFETNQVGESRWGNRISTVLFYLTDVEQGGGTSFPLLKQLLLPKKGSAAFWYNLHASGDVDTRTLHAACPIIAGSKTVLNRWIREHDQSDRRPCNLWNDKFEGFL